MSSKAVAIEVVRSFAESPLGIKIAKDALLSGWTPMQGMIAVVASATGNEDVDYCAEIAAELLAKVEFEKEQK